MHALTRFLALGVCATAVAAVQAQSRPMAGGTPKTATVPSASARAAQAAPQPGGLRPIFPAGLSSGSGASVSQDPIARSTSPVPPSAPDADAGAGTGTGVPGGANGNTNGNGNNNAGNGDDPGTGTPTVATNIVGAGPTVRGPAQDLAGAGGFSAHDQARSFFFADANKDGELTRAETARLSILTLPFEEMDRNFDGVITRFEYEDSLR